MSLNSRTRVRATLNHQEPDRVPLDLGGRCTNIHKHKYGEILAYLGIDSKFQVDPFYSVMDPDRQFLERLGVDIYYLYLKGPEYVTIHTNTDGSYINEWGITVKEVGYHSQRVTHPLESATKEDLNKYSWPNPTDHNRTEGLKAKADHLYTDTDYALFAAPVNGGIFEFAQHLRGMTKFLMDLVENKKFVNELLDRLLEVQIGLWDEFLGAVGNRIEVAQLADDFGTQQNLLISPTMFREFFKPRYAQLIDFIKTKTEAKVFLHCDGAIFKLIPDLCEMGIDVLNPIQPTAKGMDPVAIKKEFGDKLVFHGGIDNQHILPEGSPRDVQNAVDHCISSLASGGGYILAPAHIIEPDVPIENIFTLFDTAREAGVYPINLIGQQ